MEIINNIFYYLGLETNNQTNDNKALKEICAKNILRNTSVKIQIKRLKLKI